MHKSIKFSLLLLSLLWVLGGCSSSSDPGQQEVKSSASPEAQPLQKLSIMLDWYPNAVHSFLYAAKEKGYFAAEGLDVDIQMPAGTNDSLKLTAAGKVDLALSYQPQVLLARGEQIPVKSIGAVVRHPLNHLMVAENSGITRPKDLAGRTVGFSSIPLYEAMVKTMVKQDGGDPGSVKLVDVGFDLIPALSTGQVNGLIGGFINHEQLLLQKEGHPVTSIDPTQYGVPDYYELVLVASETGLSNKQDELRRFMKAAAKGQRYVSEHPQDALSLLMKHEDSTSPLDADIESQSLNILLPLMDAGDKAFGYQDPASWTLIEKWLKDNELLKQSGEMAQDAFVNL
ncbi:ABC transporter substrate-binding protein [Paenibacillus sp. YPG26]|uniref:ABC transporter substrate-binding protein n=1 Tax=Paenibacillus sp. YPG26 TaxID=2878915 RepID=UPI00203BF6CD|nr:ABC transporter substrate-binding protein [Paenibacillus sp. YPG26]USB33080.1 ABC transporter substrate-binding protein [Paenibacillus sp. YPG26]